MDLFGPIVTAADVRRAAENTLQTWLPTYVAAFNRSVGHQMLRPPLAYDYRPTEQSYTLGENDSVIMVEVPATTETQRQGDGAYIVTWQLVVDLFVRGGVDWRSPEDVSGSYGGIVAAVLVQKSALGGIATATRWKSTALYEGELDGARHSGQAKSTFEVVTESALSSFGGPATPDPAPQQGSVPVSSVTINN